MKRMRVMSFLIANMYLGAHASAGKAQSAAGEGSSSSHVTSHFSNSRPAHLDLSYKRPTEKTKIRNYFFDAFGPYPVAGAAILGAVNQAHNAPPEWGQGFNAYGERVGSHFGIALTTTTTRYVLAEAFREDTLYYRCECTGVIKRMEHAVISTVTARRGADGHRRLSFPDVIAAYVGATTAIYGWYPGRYGVKDSLRMGNYALLAAGVGNIGREFIYGGPHTLFSNARSPRISRNRLGGERLESLRRANTIVGHNARIPHRLISQDVPQVPSLARATLASLWSPFNSFLEWFGELGIFAWQVMRAAVRRPFEGRELMRQLDEIGSKSLPLVALAGAAIGAVLSLESRSSLVRFGAKSMLPAALVFSIIHETGPIVTGLVVSGRVGAGIGAELGSMKVTEQIDAIEASGVNPYKYLAFTRILACVLMLPLLTLAADFCGVLIRLDRGHTGRPNYLYANSFIADLPARASATFWPPRLERSCSD